MVALLLATLLSQAELVDKNLHIAHEIAEQYTRRGYPLEDSYQSAVVGLIISARKYGGGSDVPFDVFCRKDIRSACSKDAMYFTSRVPLKPWIAETIAEYHWVKREMESNTGYEPTFRETCDRLGVRGTRRDNLWCAIHIDCGINQYETGYTGYIDDEAQ